MKRISKTLIIIPTYNEEKFISRTIISCLDQTLKTKICIVDNCSKDNTVKIVNKFKKNNSNIDLIQNKINL